MMLKYLKTKCHECGYLTVFYDSVHLLSKRNVSIACHYNIFPSLFIFTTPFQIFYIIITYKTFSYCMFFYIKTLIQLCNLFNGFTKIAFLHVSLYFNTIFFSFPKHNIDGPDAYMIISAERISQLLLKLER